MRFTIRADRRITVAFEPTAAEYLLEPGEIVTVEWSGESGDGMVSIESGDFVVAAPSGGYSRAWNSDGKEIYVGPESGADAN